MKQVYSVYNSAEAHIIKHYLEQNDIEAHIHGEALTGAIGGIAADDHIKIMVADEDVERARELIQEWEGSVEPIDRVEVMAEAKEKTNNAIILLAVGALMGWFAHSIFMPTSQYEPDISMKETSEGFEMGYDQNNDGKDDYISFYKDQYSTTASSRKVDFNFDGTFDLFSKVDERGLTISDEVDYDFDGRLETKNSYHNGQIYKSETDDDGDGIADRIGFYEHESLVEYHILNPKTQQLVKTQQFKNQLLTSADFDSDGNGKMDTRYTYDQYEEVANKEKIPEK